MVCASSVLQGVLHSTQPITRWAGTSVPGIFLYAEATAGFSDQYYTPSSLHLQELLSTGSPLSLTLCCHSQCNRKMPYGPKLVCKGCLAAQPPLCMMSR